MNLQILVIASKVKLALPSNMSCRCMFEIPEFGRQIRLYRRCRQAACRGVHGSSAPRPTVSHSHCGRSCVLWKMRVFAGLCQSSTRHFWVSCGWAVNSDLHLFDKWNQCGMCWTAWLDMLDRVWHFTYSSFRNLLPGNSICMGHHRLDSNHQVAAPPDAMRIVWYQQDWDCRSRMTHG